MIKTTKIRALEKQVLTKELQIESLLEVTKAINNNYSSATLFRIYEFILRAQMGVNRLLVLHKNETWANVCSYGLQILCDGEQIDLNIPLLSYVEDIAYVQQLEKPHKNDFIEQFDIIQPIYHKDLPLAYLLLGQFGQYNNDTHQERLRFIQTITNIIVVAIENKRLFKQQLEQEKLRKELELAERVQNMMLPDAKDLPNNKILQVQAVYMPHRNIGGDYYDYIAINQNEFICCIADVAGKGIAAALLMSNVQAALRILASETPDLKKLVTKINERVLEITGGDKFITLFIAKYNALTRELSYINAGHNPPILYAENNLRLLKKGSTVLGILHELPFLHCTTITLPKNAFILTYTDGLTDLENEAGEFFEMERLQNFIIANAQLAVSDFSSKLLQQIETFRGKQLYTDDISVMMYRIN